MKIFRQKPIQPEPIPFNRLEFYKENYYKEIERRNSLTNEIALQGTVMIALISGIYVLLTAFKNPIPCVVLFFNFFIAVDILLILITGYHLLKSYYKFNTNGRTTLLLPPLRIIEGYYDDCKAASDQEEFENYLKDQFITLSDQLVASNNDKSSYLTTSSRWMTRSFGGSAVIIGCFLVNYVAEPLISSYLKNAKHTTVSKNEQRPKSVGSGSRAEPAKDTTATAAPTPPRTATSTGKK